MKQIGLDSMQLTVLVDNNTLIDRYFTGEQGLSFYLEEADWAIGETFVDGAWVRDSLLDDTALVY